MKSKRTFTISLMLLIAVFISGIFLSPLKVSAENANWYDTMDKSDVHAITEKIMKDNRIPGCVVVATDGTTTRFYSYGYGDNGKKVNIDENSLFILGSTTKAFTSLAVLAAEQDGLLDLDANVSKYIPWLDMYLDGRKTEITLRQLLSHSSGIPYNTFYKTPLGDYDGILEKTVRQLDGIKLDFKPGTKYKYVNDNYSLLAYVLATVSGQSYEEYLTEKVLKPLGMNNTYLYVEDAVNTGKMTKGYKPFFMQAGEYAAPVEGGQKAGGWLITCASDLQIWLKAQLGYGNVPEQLAQLIKKSHDPSENCRQVDYAKGETSYVYGWNVSQDAKSISHSGGLPTYGSSIIMDMSRPLAVGVLCNCELAPAYYIASNYFSALSGDEYKSSFMANASVDNICSIIIVLLSGCLIFAIIRTIRRVKNKRIKLDFKRLKKKSAVIKLIMLVAVIILLAMLPNLIGYTYKMLWIWSPFTVVIMLMLGILVCIFEIWLTLQTKN